MAGRQALKCSYIGYEDMVLPNILINSAKEVVLSIEMEEKISELGEIVVTDKKSKDKAINEMASVSARTISIEEMTRFSGSIQDPARMAQNYAGVAGAADDRNDIILGDVIIFQKNDISSRNVIFCILKTVNAFELFF